MSEGCENVESQAALEGTFAHDIASQALNEGRDATDYIGDVSDCKFKFVWSVENAKDLQLYIDTVNDMTFMADRVLVEQKVVFSDDNWGTSDVVAVNGTTLEIVDLKFGTFYVSAMMNEQLLDYACAALKSLPDLNDITEVRMTIVQPRHHNEEDRVRSTTMTVGEIRMWRDKILEPGIEATRDLQARLHPGNHCTFCPAKIGKCPAFQDAALEVAQEVFPDGDIEKKPTAPPLPAHLSPARIKAVLDHADMLRGWLKAVEEHAHLRAKAGDKFDGYKLVAAQGNRRYKDEKAAAKALRKEGIDPVVKHTLSPNQAQQQLGGSAKANKAFIDALCERPSRGDKLVPVSDKRPELPGADVFSESQQEKE